MSFDVIVLGHVTRHDVRLAAQTVSRVHYPDHELHKCCHNHCFLAELKFSFAVYAEIALEALS